MTFPVFVSCSPEDSKLVRPIVSLLRAMKELTFHDIDSIQAGNRRQPQIDKALKQSTIIVVFWCVHASRSNQVKRDYQLAINIDKDVIPVLLDATPLPDALSDYQWVDLHERKIAFRSLTEQMDTTTPHGEFLFSVFGALAQYERALARERILAGLEAAKKRGRRGGRPKAISDEKLEAIIAALDSGASKASVCRNFGIKRTTLYDALRRSVS
jgi:hypothetical protein